MITLFPAFIKNTPENELFVKFTDLFDINYKVKNKNKIKKVLSFSLNASKNELLPPKR